MARDYNFCPMCAAHLVINSSNRQHCGNCKWTHYDNPNPVVVILGSYPDDPLRRVVMIRRKNNPGQGGWALPGGHVDHAEIVQEAAIREFKEETGLDIELEELVGAWTTNPTSVNRVVIAYLARVVGGTMMSGDDAADVQLFSQEDCPQAVFGSHAKMIKDWWSGKMKPLSGRNVETHAAIYGLSGGSDNGP